MIYAKFWKGVHPRDLKSGPNIWLGYVGWWVEFNLSQLPGAPSTRILASLRAIPPHGYTRVHDGRGGDVRKINGAKNPESWWSAWAHVLYFRTVYRWPKRLGAALRPRWSRRYGGRCDWTDRDRGLLYGGDGEALRELFEDYFLRAIEPSAKTKLAVGAAVDDLVCNLAEHDQQIN